MSAVDLTPAGTVRVLRAQLAAAGLPTDDHTVVAFADRLTGAAARRGRQVDALHTVFGVPAAIRDA